MADEQDRAEFLDDDKLEGDFPPDQPIGVDTFGITAAEERWGEPLAEAISRQEPDVPAGLDAINDAVADEAPIDAMDDGTPDEIATDVITAAEADMVQEREGAPAAEETAVHVVPDDDRSLR